MKYHRKKSKFASVRRSNNERKLSDKEEYEYGKKEKELLYSQYYGDVSTMLRGKKDI